MDSSQVGMLDAYTTTRCPVRVVLDQRPPAALEPLPPAAAVKLRRVEGTAFESQILGRLAELDGAVVVDPGVLESPAARGHNGPAPSNDTRPPVYPRSPAEIQAQTLAAMGAGAPIIIGGWLPSDEENHRTGRPDVLLASEVPGQYHPVEVKGHRTSRPAEDMTVLLSSLQEPFRQNATERPDMAPIGGRRLANGLQLAHYHRMLEATGHGARHPWAAVIGQDSHVLWLDLDAADAGQHPEAAAPEDRRTTQSLLDRYDHEFEFRVSAVAADAVGTPVVVPVKVHECNACPWRHHCLPVIEERECVSTVQGVGYTAWRAYQRMGIETVTDLTTIDWASADVADRWPQSGPGLADVIGDPRLFAQHLADPESSHGQLLTEGGFSSAGSLANFDQRVLQSNEGQRALLATHIDAARALTKAADSAVLRRGVERLAVPRFDREIDIDMESEVGGYAYLWGTYDSATDLATHDVIWSTDPLDAAAGVFVKFWSRLLALLTDANAAGESIGFYCWHDQAEKTALRRGAQAAAERLGHTDAPEEVERFLNQNLVVDLCEIARQDLVTGGSKSLKAIAPKAGFAWRDDDPDGAASMVWHANAVDPTLSSEQAEGWRARLIAYNEDDVRAEAAVRTWMRNTPFPRATDFDDKRGVDPTDEGTSEAGA